MARLAIGIKPGRSAAAAALAPPAPAGRPALTLSLTGECIGTDVAKRGFHRIGLATAGATTALSAPPGAGPPLALATTTGLIHIEPRLGARGPGACAPRPLAPVLTCTAAVDAPRLMAPWRGLEFIGPDRLLVRVVLIGPDVGRVHARLQLGRRLAFDPASRRLPAR